MTLMRCLGCGELVSPGPRCPRCQRAWTTAYDRTRPAHHALYSTSAWKRLSAEVRASATRCRWCLRPLPLRRRVADHVIPLAERPDLALDRANLAVSCTACNVRRGRNARLPDLDEPLTTNPRPTVAARARPASFLPVSAACAGRAGPSGGGRVFGRRPAASQETR
jgi:5-methylcytosine-specific restriction endonuclease McrA